MIEKSLAELQYKRAKRRTQEIKSFYQMIIGYCLMVPFLIFINFQTSQDHLWFWYPTIGAGISIIGYGIYLFATKKWEQKQIKKIIEKENIRS